MLQKLLKLFSLGKKSLLLIIVGTITWSVTMVKSGWIYPYGMGFWGPNGHDGIWHLGLIESLARGSWQMPTFAGEPLKNYHIGFDLILAVLHKVSGIPSVNIYFQIIPPILAFLIGLLTYKFVFLWTKSENASFWSTFFVYFGGSWGWVLGKGESTFWSQQQISTLINPPFALSLIFMLLGLLSAIKYLKTNIVYHMLLATLFFGVLIEVKAYAGILVIIGLLLAGLYSLLKEKDWKIFKVFLGTSILSLLIFLPFNKDAATLFVFQPFWFLETMMGLTDRVGWLKFYSAMTNYRLGNVWFKAIPAYTIAFVIFWIGNMGTRMTKEFLVFKWVRNWKNLGWMEVFITTIILTGVIIPMLFLQKGTPWNTIQFFYYSLFFSGILAGISFVDIARYFKLQGTLKIYVIEGILLLFTLPTTVDTIKQYLPARPPSMISNEELSALNFLSKQPQGVVLTYPFDRAKAKEAESNPPRPLYLYESTAYVSAFANKSVYLEDEVNLDITGYSWPERRVRVLDFLNTLDSKKARAFLLENKIKYVYWLKGQRARLGEGQLGIKRIFENKEVDIYKVL